MDILSKIPQGVLSLTTKYQISNPKALADAILQALPVRNDRYTENILKTQFKIQRDYVLTRISTTKDLGYKIRLSSIPEDISENIVKHILRTHGEDKTCIWDCDTGDLHSVYEGKQECKCFTSNGPLSFTPSSAWDVIYFLDAREWLSDDGIFKLYRIPLKRTSEEWKAIKMNKKQTFEDQCKQGRRPRISWEGLFPQISNHCNLVFQGSFESIFTPPTLKQDVLQ